MTILKAKGLSKTYGTGAAAVHAIRDVSLTLEPGVLTALRGPSGSGKTTLLNLLGGLLPADRGRVLLGGTDLADADGDLRADLRRRRLGFVFQSFALLPTLTAAENVEVPLRLLRTPATERRERVAELLELVGLAPHAGQRPDQLSGGQQQRVGIARALASRPEVLIADEPTGQLDSRTAQAMLLLLSRLVHERGIAAILSTHDPRIAGLADRALTLADGRLEG